MKLKKLSESILKSIRSEGFKYIDLDTVIETFLPTNKNRHTVKLEFKQKKENGDYLIISDSCDKTVLISDVIVNKDYTFSYIFNELEKTEKDLVIYVTKEMLCY